MRSLVALLIVGLSLSAQASDFESAMVCNFSSHVAGSSSIAIQLFSQDVKRSTAKGNYGDYKITIENFSSSKNASLKLLITQGRQEILSSSFAMVQPNSIPSSFANMTVNGDLNIECNPGVINVNKTNSCEAKAAKLAEAELTSDTGDGTYDKGGVSAHSCKLAPNGKVNICEIGALKGGGDAGDSYRAVLNKSCTKLLRLDMTGEE